jgi:hypothetical protein
MGMATLPISPMALGGLVIIKFTGWAGRERILTCCLIWKNRLAPHLLKLVRYGIAKVGFFTRPPFPAFVSENGKDFTPAGTIETTGNQQKEEISRVYTFKAPASAIRYVKFEVKGTIHLFDWHPSAGGNSWVFIDEIVVR